MMFTIEKKTITQTRNTLQKMTDIGSKHGQVISLIFFIIF